MSSALRVAKKEVGSYFSSLAALIFIGVFLGVSLFTFFWGERFFARNIADLRPLFEWMPVLLIFLVSAVTMRMWSEERRSGTVEFLMTAPVSPVSLISGKFLACFFLVALALALTLPLPITVSLLGPLDWGPVIGGYVATLFLAAAYCSIGLFVSARTDSQIVSLIVTALVCGIFYILGSDALTSLAGNKGGEFLRLLGSGSRFESITRGVIDLRDIYYYLSIFGVFAVLTVFALERLRWSKGKKSKRHVEWFAFSALAVANLVAANLWLDAISFARIDLTDGQIYSISPATKRYLRDLEEPLLIRGYFSSQTHPLLAPLAPRLQDLLKEYEVAGEGRVRVEIVDPIKSPAIEEEAGRRFGVRPVPFQTTSKYQASVTNSYFDVVIQYGDEFEKLGFEDLIEVKQSGPSDVEVDLRNPEYDITRAIKKVLTSFRAAGAIWTALPGPVALKAYISDTTDLPEPLPTLKSDIEALIKDYETESGGKFSGEIIDPSAGDGAVAKALEAKGLRSMSLGLLDPRKFWFHLVLDEGGRSVDVPLPETPNKDALKRVIDAELKRLAPGAIRTVALYTPPIDPGQPEYDAPPSGLRFSRLEAQLRENAQIRQTELDNGRAPEQADALVVVAPVGLDDRQRYAIDQFLMRGGTVILAASAFRPQLTNELGIKQSATGLDDMLAHYGVTIKKEMALDEENTPLPVPVTRDVGGFQIRDIRMLDYPHFIDIRGGLAKAGAPTAGLGQLTMSWASPIEIDAQKTENMTVTRLIESSDHSWASASEEIVPDYGAYPDRGYPDPEKTGKQLLGVMLEGSFASYFAGRPNPLLQAEKTAAGGGEEKGEAPGAEVVSSTMERSPPGARLVVYGSSSFLSDDALSLISGLDRSDYAAPMILIENTIDWSLEDRGLLDIRNRQGHFARSLAPLDDGARAFWEGLNYMLALVGLVAAFVAHRMIRQSTNRRRLDALKA